MKRFLIHLVLTAIAILIVANVVGGVAVSGFGTALVAAVVLGIVNAIIRPIMVMLTLPISIVTLGLFLFVVNALVLWLVGVVVPEFHVSGFIPALLGSLLLTVLNVAISWLVPD